jgi:hypothetical protein
MNTQDVWLYFDVGQGQVRYPTTLYTTAGGDTSGVVITRP